MPVHRLLEIVGDLPLPEIYLRVRVASDLEVPLEEVGEWPAEELADWALLIDIEDEAAQVEAENAKRRKG